MLTSTAERYPASSVKVSCASRSRDPGVPLSRTAADFGVGESGLQNWIQDAVQGAPRGDGLCRAVRRRRVPGTSAPGETSGARGRGPATGFGLLRSRACAGKTVYPIAGEHAADETPVAVTCRWLGVSDGAPPSAG